MSIFKGLKVIELASVLAGPSVGQFFAELGAEVIKVENPKAGGDVTRSWKTSGEKTDDRSAYFCSVNWGKKSVGLDLNTEDGQQKIRLLLKTADLVITSYKPGDAKKLNVDYQTLSDLNPRLIYSAITGYGSDNPRVGYDAVIQAEAGFMFMNGEPGGASLKMPVALIDILAAHQLKEAILLALIQRERNGKGDFVEVSLLQTAISSLANQATNWLMTGKLPQKQGSAHPNIAPYGDVFKTADGAEIILAIGSDPQFQNLCALLTLHELTNDERYSTNRARVVNRPSLNLQLQKRIGLFSSPELMQRIGDAKIPAGVIRNLREVFVMEEALELVMEAAELGGIRNFAANTPFQSKNPLSPPPHLGEHTNEVLGSLN
jgi:crotonobetainyl-CoA:carnitine CoA-transferase CaiB-like acyl-CoA transferase